VQVRPLFFLHSPSAANYSVVAIDTFRYSSGPYSVDMSRAAQNPFIPNKYRCSFGLLVQICAVAAQAPMM